MFFGYVCTLRGDAYFESEEGSTKRAHCLSFVCRVVCAGVVGATSSELFLVIHAVTSVGGARLTCVVGGGKSKLVRKSELVEGVNGADLWFDVAGENGGGLDELVADRSLVSLVVQTQSIGVEHATTLAAAEVNLHDTTYHSYTAWIGVNLVRINGLVMNQKSFVGRAPPNHLGMESIRGVSPNVIETFTSFSRHIVTLSFDRCRGCGILIHQRVT